MQAVSRQRWLWRRAWAQAGRITEFPIPTSSSDPWGITAGRDGNLWFTEQDKNRIGRITTSGIIAEFSFSTRPMAITPRGITAGPDGNLWFTESGGDRIGRITTCGRITEFSGNKIGRITTR